MAGSIRGFLRGRRSIQLRILFGNRLVDASLTWRRVYARLSRIRDKY